MDFDDFSWGWRFGDMLGNVIWGLFSFFVFLVVVGLIFLLVRFLLVATRAAQVYLQLNAPPAPAQPSTTQPSPTSGAAPTATAAAPPTGTTRTATAPTTPAATATTKPAPRTRTPKTPPTP